ncbi:hypothetical protein ACFWGI_06250 [Streptomyces niveus]|uniref:hypothetical protein n=1 Tax=Streptomyces niveus TaxID=193462 RepID=UPI0036690B88
MTTSRVTRERLRITVDLPSPELIVDMFGDERAVSQVTLSFTDTALKAVRLTAADGAAGEDTYVDREQMKEPESWPQWLRDAYAEHRPSPFGTGQQLADSLLAGLRAEAMERSAHADANERRVLNGLGELEPAEVLSRLDELGLLTGSLLRAAKDVLTHLDRRTYGPSGSPQN